MCVHACVVVCMWRLPRLPAGLQLLTALQALQVIMPCAPVPGCRAVGLGASGCLYVGVNLEFARLPLYNSVHAEQFLLINALHHGEREIRRLAVSAAPCGHCRQFYSELACAVGGSVVLRMLWHCAVVCCACCGWAALC